MTRPWSREQVITELRDEIWLHLSSTATPHEILLHAAALLGLDDTDVARLADIHLVLHPDVRALLDACPSLLRRLSSSTSPTVEISHDRVRGAVDWLATSRTRARERTAAVVTRPQVRDRDVQPSRVLALLLNELRDRARRTGLRALDGDGSTLSQQLTEVGRRAAGFASHRALREVAPLAPTNRELAAMSTPRLVTRNETILQAYRTYDALVRRRDPDAVVAAVERQGFAAASDGALFELLVLFRIRTALVRLGFDLGRLRLFEGSIRFTARRGADEVRAWYQRLPPEWGRTSRYPAALLAHQVSAPHDLRPDLVLRVQPAGGVEQWTVVEAKTTTSGKPVPVLFRRALTDLLAYRASFAEVLDGQPRWGLGVVWGSALHAADHDVRVCTPDHLEGAIARLVSS